MFFCSSTTILFFFKIDEIVLHICFTIAYCDWKWARNRLSWPVSLSLIAPFAFRWSSLCLIKSPLTALLRCCVVEEDRRERIKLDVVVDFFNSTFSVRHSVVFIARPLSCRGIPLLLFQFRGCGSPLWFQDSECDLRPSICMVIQAQLMSSWDK